MFYIKELTIFRDNKTSITQFMAGLNIIVGPSNTGKSLILDCINYMMGAKSTEHRFDPNLHIHCIQIKIDVEGKLLSITREINSSKFTVAGNVASITNGEYCLSNKSKMPINNVWLSLLHIPNDIKILNTKSGKLQSLTFRSIYHLLLIDENRISQTTSILNAPHGLSRILPTLSALIYLMTGNSIKNTDYIDKKTQKIQIEAINTFVNNTIKSLQTQKAICNNVHITEDPYTINKQIQQILDKITSQQSLLDETLRISKKVSYRINSINSQLSENEILLDRNNQLMSQYYSDIKRMTFIVEGNYLLTKQKSIIGLCPFCNNKMTIKPDKIAIESIATELEKIKLQIRDLKVTQESIKAECTALEEEKTALIADKKDCEDKINNEIAPQIGELKLRLHEYKKALIYTEKQKNVVNFSDFLKKEQEMATVLKSDTINISTDINNKFKDVFATPINEELDILLKKCHYLDYHYSFFDFEHYDAVINGHMKKIQGQGYRAFINMIVILAIHNCLQKNNLFELPFLIADSSLQALKESEYPRYEVPEYMKIALLEYLAKRKMQTILIENEIPYINSKDIHIIYSSKDKMMDIDY